MSLILNRNHNIMYWCRSKGNIMPNATRGTKVGRFFRIKKRRKDKLTSKEYINSIGPIFQNIAYCYLFEQNLSFMIMYVLC